MEILLWLVGACMTVGGATYIAMLFDSVVGRILGGLLGAVLGFTLFLGLVCAGCLILVNL